MAKIATRATLSRTMHPVLFVAIGLLLIGCSAGGPAAAAEESIRGPAFDFANVSNAYSGAVMVLEEDVSADGNSATVKLRAADESREWALELEKQDGNWVVIDGTLEFLEDVTTYVP